LNSSGDPIEASEVLNKAETHTYDVEAIMDQIPGLYEELHEIFPGQLKEINDSYDRLLAEDYVIPEEDFEENITKAEKRVENSLRDLEKIEIDTVEVANRDTASAIDELYDIMEREMNAKKYVTTNRHTLREYIDHATKNNRQLMIELDHTSQSYVLNHNELGRARGFQTEIDELSRRHHQVETQLDAHQLPYSEVQRYFKESFKVLDDIENQQVEIDDSLHELRTGEQAAQEKVETFEFTLRNLKRFVEKQRLPGLPGDYLEFFFVATDRVEELSGALNKIRIDMEDVNRLVKACQEDLAQLDQKTTELVDDAALTEQMMQYANRYRHTHQEIKAAIDTSLNLFSKEYHYHAALTTIGDALEKAEPGAYKRIENFYFNNRDLV
jgi:septation ring formation regulator